MTDPTPEPFLSEPVPPNAKERLRSAVPDSLVPALVRARTRRKLRSPQTVAAAREEMAWLLDAVADPAEVERATLAYLERDTWRSELRWHPRMIIGLPVEGVEHLQRAHALGRGVVLSFLHHGHYEATTPAISAAADLPLHIAISPEMVGPTAPAFLRQHVRVGLHGRSTGVNVGAGAGVLVDVLTGGGILAIATDVPGRTPVRFLGKDRRGSSGAARIAAGTNSPVIVLTAHQEDGQLGLRLAEAVEPRDFESPDALLTHLLAAQEPAITAWPEGYHQPRLRWGTTDGAAPTPEA